MKTRSLKELLELTLTEGNKQFIGDTLSGLCGFIRYRLYFRGGKIDAKEYEKIRKYIESHRPKPGDKHYRASMKGDSYYWKKDAWTPRQKWLKDQIKLLERNEKKNS